MPVRVKLDDLLHARRMTLTDLADRVGLTLANLSILKTGKAKAIRFSTLEAICRELDCQPGDIRRYEPAETDAEAVTARDVLLDPRRRPRGRRRGVPRGRPRPPREVLTWMPHRSGRSS